jgi:uncharacterized membrane protein
LGGKNWKQISKTYHFKPGGNKMPRFCASCGSLVAEGALACTSCGATVGPSVGGGAAPATATTGLTENLAGALAYVTFLPAVAFLLLEPFNKNPFVRFHAFQSIFLTVALFVLNFASMLLGSALGMAGLAVLPLLWLATLGLWIVLIYKAYQGRIFKLPVIGDLAEQRAHNA